MLRRLLPLPLIAVLWSVFGPAQGMHGATYVVEATFRRRELDADGIVVDIAAATAALDQVLGRLRYRNLDQHPDFDDVVTTTEVLSGWVADQLSASPATDDLDGLEVTLRESPDAWVSYTRDE